MNQPRPSQMPVWRQQLGPLVSGIGLALLFLPGCTLHAPESIGDPSVFSPANSESYGEFADPAALAKFATESDGRYLIGPGDELTVHIYGQQELTGQHIVGPDGVITVPVAGPVRISDLSREEAGEKITQALAPFYVVPAATVRIDSYTSHSVLVLGRVAKPGALHFEAPPTLLEAITRAGALPTGGVGSEKAALTRCAIFRGRDRVVWIDLKRLLKTAELSLNLELRRGDVVYLPDADDQLVYVLGEVHTPGAYPLTPDMSFLDALANAGGPTVDAAPSSIEVVRPGSAARRVIDLADLRGGDAMHNLDIEQGDIIFVPRNGLAEVGYVFEKLAPGATMLLFGAAMAL